jgi:hypothetical protein
MSRVSKLLTAESMLAAILLARAAQAIDIKDYFKMADQDQGRFDQSLLTGAEKLLDDEGRTDLADQLDRLFTEVKTGNKLSEGMADYQANLGAMVIAEVKREARNANLPHLQAERAFLDAAKDHGIPLPPAFDTIASDFHPQFPPKPPMITQNADGTFTVQKLPPNRTLKDTKANEGLVIPPQVVVPLIPTPERQQ